MDNKSFPVNKGVDSDMEFQGFTAQYIAIAALGLLCCLLLFATCYFMDLPFLINAGLCGGTYSLWHIRVHRMNRKYGRYGLMKKNSFHKIPEVIKIRDRELIRKLGTKTNTRNEH
jgi:hypothetical protein